jgi:hypothetical protein
MSPGTHLQPPLASLSHLLPNFSRHDASA